MKKNYISAAIGTVIIGAGILYFTNQSGLLSDITVSPSGTPTMTPTSPAGATSTPAVSAEDYRYWADVLDPLNRRLVLDADCTSIVPSQVDYYSNDVQIMLDNTASAKPRVLKVGAREYSILAHGWRLTTLHADTLPAKFTMFCGDLELGQLVLLAK